MSLEDQRTVMLLVVVAPGTDGGEKNKGEVDCKILAEKYFPTCSCFRHLESREIKM